MQIAQSRFGEDVLVEGEKQMTQVLCLSVSQPSVFKRPVHVFLPVSEMLSSTDINFDRRVYVSLRLLRGHRDDYILNSSFEQSNGYSKASQAPSPMGDGHRHFRTNSDSSIRDILLHIRPDRLVIEEDIYPSSHSQCVSTCTRFAVLPTEFLMCDPTRGRGSKESLGQYGE